MKRALRIASLTGIMLLVSVGAARADTLQFVVSGQAGSATFDLLRNPTVTSFSNGYYFTVSLNNVTINLLCHSFLAPPFVLEFSNTSTRCGFRLVSRFFAAFPPLGSQTHSRLDY